tara:strand:+ start:247 stop:444 length:198 start_codon:yes stop_codon:yes gene_type:complete
MKFFLAQCVSFILGAVIAIILMKQFNPQIVGGDLGADHKPHKTTPKRIGPPPEHDINKRPNRPQQ